MIAGIANLARRLPVGTIPKGLFEFDKLDWGFNINDLFLYNMKLSITQIIKKGELKSEFRLAIDC